MEVSSHALDQSRVAGVSFDAACVTNVTHDHLDYHASLRDYRLAKAKLFEHLRTRASRCSMPTIPARPAICASSTARC